MGEGPAIIVAVAVTLLFVGSAVLTAFALISVILRAVSDSILARQLTKAVGGFAKESIAVLVQQWPTDHCDLRLENIGHSPVADPLETGMEDFMTDGFVFVMERGGEAEEDRLKILVPPQRTARKMISALTDHILLAYRRTDSKGRKYAVSPASHKGIQSLSLDFLSLPDEVSYASSRLHELLALPEHERPSLAVWGAAVAPNEILGGAIQIGRDGEMVPLFPVLLVGLLQGLARRVAEAASARNSHTGISTLIHRWVSNVRSSITFATTAVRVTWLLQLALGIVFWTGHATELTTLHSIIGLLFLLAVGALAAMGVQLGLNARLVNAAFLWGAIVMVFGLIQSIILPGSSHWIIQILHLFMGIIALALAEIIAVRLRRANAHLLEATNDAEA